MNIQKVPVGVLDILEYVNNRSLEICRKYNYSVIDDKTIINIQKDLNDVFKDLSKEYYDCEYIKLIQSLMNETKLLFHSIKDGYIVTCNKIYKNDKVLNEEKKDMKINIKDISAPVKKCLDLEEEFYKNAKKIIEDNNSTCLTYNNLLEIHKKIEDLLENLKEECLYNNKILRKVEEYCFDIESISMTEEKYQIRHDGVYRYELVPQYIKIEEPSAMDKQIAEQVVNALDKLNSMSK